MADQRSLPSARGDEADLFRAFNEQLMEAVAGAVIDSTPHVIEDACSYAWAQFLHHQPRRDLNWQGWLYRTAQREAWRLEHELRDHGPLRVVDGEPTRGALQAVDPRDPHEIHEAVGDALSIVGQLPPRLGRVAMLRALGLSHQDISELTGDSPTRVGQLIARANLEIADVLIERAHHERENSPRAERLWELEHEQPEWLVEKIGRVPSRTRRGGSEGMRQRAWRRAALALDDLRQVVGSDRLDEVVDARRPTDPELRRPWDAARRAIEELDHERGRVPGRAIGD